MSEVDNSLWLHVLSCQTTSHPHSSLLVNASCCLTTVTQCQPAAGCVYGTRMGGLVGERLSVAVWYWLDSLRLTKLICKQGAHNDDNEFVVCFGDRIDQFKSRYMNRLCRTRTSDTQHAHSVCVHASTPNGKLCRDWSPSRSCSGC